MIIMGKQFIRDALIFRRSSTLGFMLFLVIRLIVLPSSVPRDVTNGQRLQHLHLNRNPVPSSTSYFYNYSPFQSRPSSLASPPTILRILFLSQNHGATPPLRNPLPIPVLTSFTPTITSLIVPSNVFKSYIRPLAVGYASMDQ